MNHEYQPNGNTFMSVECLVCGEYKEALCHTVTVEEKVKIVPPPIHEHYDEKTDRAELCGKVFCPHGFVGVTPASEEKEIVIPNRERQQIPKPDPMNKIFGSSTSNGIEEAISELEKETMEIARYADKGLDVHYGKRLAALTTLFRRSLHAVADKAREEIKNDIRNKPILMTGEGASNFQAGFEAALGEVEKWAGENNFEDNWGVDAVYVPQLQSFINSLKKKQ